MNLLDHIERTEEGYLKQLNDWSPEVANALAEEANIHLSSEHWLIIYAARAFYLEYQTSPSIRALINLIKSQGHDMNSTKLHLLFPQPAVQLMNKISGLPKPVRCL